MINDFCKDVNTTVRGKGFWDSMDESIEAIMKSDGYFSKDTLVATKEAFVTQKIMLISSELGEAVEAMRNNNYGLEKKDTFEDELADVFIRLCDLCGELNIDIDRQIEWKMGYNKQREHKHGKGF